MNTDSHYFYIRKDGVTSGDHIFIGWETIENAGIKSPHKIITDLNQNMYLSDIEGHCIYYINQSGQIQLFSGTPNTTGSIGNTNTPKNDMLFNSPSGIDIDKSNNVYICDTNNNQVVRIDYNGIGCRMSGNGESGFNDGKASLCNHPKDIVSMGDQSVYFTDTNNHCIRKTMSGLNETKTISGYYLTEGDNNGFFPDSEMSLPSGICSTDGGTIYFIDDGNKKIKKINPNKELIEFITEYPTLNNPIYITNLNNQNVLLVDLQENNTSKVWKISEDGSFTIYYQNKNIISLARTKSGDIYYIEAIPKGD
jgi:hypothetical protein